MSKFVCVKWYYDGLKGKVIQWANKHGNTNHDPSQLVWLLEPGGELLEHPGSGVIGSVSSFKKWLEEKSSASFPLIDPKNFSYFSKEASNIARRKNLGKMLKTLREKATTELSEAEKGELKTLTEKLMVYANWKQERAESLKANSPLGAYALYQEIAKEFKGDEIGKKAKEMVALLKKDKGFQNELKAESLLKKAQGLKEKKKKNLKKAMGLLQAIIKKYPDSVAAKKSTQLLAEWKKTE